MDMDQEVLEDAAAGCVKGGVRGRGGGGGEKNERVGRRIVHRACTGIAERGGRVFSKFYGVRWRYKVHG